MIRITGQSVVEFHQFIAEEAAILDGWMTATRATRACSSRSSGFARADPAAYSRIGYVDLEQQVFFVARRSAPPSAALAKSASQLLRAAWPSSAGAGHVELARIVPPRTAGHPGAFLQVQFLLRHRVVPERLVVAAEIRLDQPEQHGAWSRLEIRRGRPPAPRPSANSSPRAAGAGCAPGTSKYIEALRRGDRCRCSSSAIGFRRERLVAEQTATLAALDQFCTAWHCCGCRHSPDLFIIMLSGSRLPVLWLDTLAIGLVEQEITFARLRRVNWLRVCWW